MSFVPSNINELISSITQSGLAFSNRYEVLFETPAGFGTTNIPFMRNLMVRCDSILIPGRSLSTTPYRFYGPARNMPYEPIYAGEMTLSVILSADLRERKFFEDWMNLVCSPSNYKFGYYDDYTTNLQIIVTTRADDPAHSFFVEEVYPKAIGDLQVGYDKDNDFLKQDITLSFRKYTPQYIGLQQPTAVPANELVGPPAPQQFLTSNGGQVNRMGYDGTVNGFYDPQKFNSIIKTQP